MGDRRHVLRAVGPGLCLGSWRRVAVVLVGLQGPLWRVLPQGTAGR
jgi:hypothetical protein